VLRLQPVRLCRKSLLGDIKCPVFISDSNVTFTLFYPLIKVGVGVVYFLRSSNVWWRVTKIKLTRSTSVLEHFSVLKSLTNRRASSIDIKITLSGYWTRNRNSLSSDGNNKDRCWAISLSDFTSSDTLMVDNIEEDSGSPFITALYEHFTNSCISCSTTSKLWSAVEQFKFDSRTTTCSLSVVRSFRRRPLSVFSSLITETYWYMLDFKI